MTTEEAIHLISNDPNYVYLKRFDYSLAKVLERFPEGAPDRTIAQALMITTEDVERVYNEIIARLKMSIADPAV